MAQIEEEVKEVKTLLKDVNDKLKASAEAAEKQIKAHSQMSEETKASVDKLLVTQGELQARLLAAEQLMVNMENKGAVAAPKSMGQMVVESDAFANFSGQGQFSLKVKNAITSLTGGSETLVRPERLAMIQPPTQKLTIRDILSWGRTTSNALEYVREAGFTNNADVVSENPTNDKPESDITFELDSAPVATIAHWINASRQVLSDSAMLASYIDGRLHYGLKLKEEAQLLNGSGVGLNILGLKTAASAYVNPGVTVQGETAIDRLRLALLQTTLALYEADGIVLSPVDWCQIELTKDTQNRYVFTCPTGMVGMGGMAGMTGMAVPGLWGRPVVSSLSMTAGDFLVGNFAQGAQGWDREDMSVVVSTENKDNFVKNMVTILCEERVGLTIFRPEAFVAGDFDGLPASA